MSIESTYVHHVYDEIALHFDKTRYNYWKQVRLFLDKIPKGSLVLDNGCGNGKYLTYRNDIEMVGIDSCKALLDICSTKYQGLLVLANGLQLPFQENIFDSSICIAVLHHLSTFEKRQHFVCEMVRCLKPNKKGLITVWATLQEQPKVFQKWEPLNTPNDFLIPWSNKLNGGSISKRYYHLFDKEEVQYLFDTISNIEIEDILYEKSNWCIVFRKTN